MKTEGWRAPLALADGKTVPVDTTVSGQMRLAVVTTKSAPPAVPRLHAGEGSIELTEPRDYTQIGEKLHEILDSEYRAGRIGEAVYRRVKGKGERLQPTPGR